jgi:uncharacterized protein (UPF0264 family)
MELLVSVRSATEVGAALAGGADIIDAKEPGRGSLGVVSSEVLREIMSRVPDHVSASAALGDHSCPEEVVSVLTSLELSPRPAPLYLKLGFAGVSSEARIERLMASAVAAASRGHAPARFIAVAYADVGRAGTVSPYSMPGLAVRSGAAGILLDTHSKDGIGLLGWMEPEDLERWVEEARSQGLLTGLAGGLALDDLERVSRASPDVVGVRGAACIGGREGRVDREQVRTLRCRLDQISGSVQGSIPRRSLAGSRNA